jgi:hypothetical protein
LSLLNNSQEIEDPSILINETIDNIRLKEKEQIRNNSDKKLIEISASSSSSRSEYKSDSD